MVRQSSSVFSLTQLVNINLFYVFDTNDGKKVDM